MDAENPSEEDTRAVQNLEEGNLLFAEGMADAASTPLDGNVDTEVLLKGASESFMASDGQFGVDRAQVHLTADVEMAVQDSVIGMESAPEESASVGEEEEEPAGEEEEMPSDTDAGPSMPSDREEDSKEKPYSCPACKQTIEGGAESVIEHLYHHSKVLARVCRECGLQTKSVNAMMRHVAEHANSKIGEPNHEAYSDDLQRLYVCVVCGNRFKFCGHVKTHLYLHSNEKRFECRICHMHFTRNHALQKHMWGSHGQRLSSDSLLGGLDGLDENSTVAVTRMGDSVGSLDASKTFQDKDAVKSAPSHKKASCDVCGKTFRFESALETHMRTHEDVEIIHNCDFCPLRFPSRKLLRRHRIVQHGVRDTGINQRYTCSVCSSRFLGTSFFASHLLEHLDAMERGQEQPSTTAATSTATEEDHAYTRQVPALAAPGAGTTAALLDTRMLRNVRLPGGQGLLSGVGTGPSRGKASQPAKRRTKVVFPSSLLNRSKNSGAAAAPRPVPVVKFACLECPQTFTDKSQYQDHVATHVKENTISCYHCSEKFHSQGDLESHLAIFFQNVAPGVNIRKVPGPGGKMAAIERARLLRDKREQEARAREKRLREERERKEREDAAQASVARMEEVVGFCKFCKEAFCSVAFLNMHMSTVHANVPTYTLVEMEDTSIQGRAVVTAHFSP